MLSVILSAAGVGGATVAGALLGFLFKSVSPRHRNMMTSFAAGVMMAASIIGLIVPAIQTVGPKGFIFAVFGLFLGAVAVSFLDRVIPYLYRFVGCEYCTDALNTSDVDRAILLVAAISIHNLPEGIAAGVGCGCFPFEEALTVTAGIMLQNIPEGLIVVVPMRDAGVSPTRAFACAFMSGVVEVVGTLIGYLASSASLVFLPFSLCFAGGTMLYVVSEEMIPQSHEENRSSAYALLFGFALMLALDFFI